MPIRSHLAVHARLATAALLAVIAPAPLRAQWGTDGEAAPRPAVTGSVMAQGIGLATRVSPAIGGRDLTEAYLTQPVVMGHVAAAGGRVALLTTLDAEGWTLRRGELAPGVYGEGYLDRRHPHTLVHELIASAEGPLGGARVSLAAGKGFAPFGTDDPMMRPFAGYPANHHLAQVLERAVAIGAVRAGPAFVEAGMFDGDEPTGPFSAPRARNFGNSRAARLTLVAAPLELQGSVARVRSPEVPAGGGADQHKASVSARWADAAGRRGLLEWASTGDVVNGRRTFTYSSLLGEGAAQARAARLALRLERTVRPEEERLLDAFRSERPATDLSVIGRTRWTIATADLTLRSPARLPLAAEPFLEVARAHAVPVRRPTVFEPAGFYGASSLWRLSAGVRVRVGPAAHRMGRYGVAAPDHVHTVDALDEAMPDHHQM